MVDFTLVWNWYSRESVLNALVEISKNREVVCVYKDLSFGKRPDIIQYPADILQSVAEGAIAFHGSVERWSQPMKLDVGMSKEELDELRIGWDLILDPDVSDFEVAKIVTLQIVEALKDHGVRSISVKFTGGKSFHVGVPFESFPEKINFQPTSSLYPELFQKIIEYIKDYIRERLRDELLAFETPHNLAKRVGKKLDEIVDENGLDPFKMISLDVFSSRHLFRLPYSLNEKTLLVSVPIKPEKILSFKKEDALPKNVRVEEKFLEPKAKGDAEGLVVEALDWYSRRKEKVERISKPSRVVKKRRIPKEFFPPCIKKTLSGLSDGRKRSIFVLVTFLRNMGWSDEEIEKEIYAWNERNIPPLRTNYIRTQLRWHFRQKRELLPPNCDNPTFYSDYKVCTPDEVCKGIKNPINYPFKVLKKRTKK